jgi:hypothetical protein
MKSRFKFAPYIRLILAVLSLAVLIFLFNFSFLLSDFDSPVFFFLAFTMLFAFYSINTLYYCSLKWNRLAFEQNGVLVKTFDGKQYGILFQEIVFTEEKQYANRDGTWKEFSVFSRENYFIISSKTYQNYEQLKAEVENSQPNFDRNQHNLQAKNKFHYTFLRLIFPVIAVWFSVGCYLHQYPCNRYTRDDLAIIRDTLWAAPQEYQTKKHYHLELTLGSNQNAIFRLENNRNNIAYRLKGGDSIAICVLKKYAHFFQKDSSHLRPKFHLRPLEIKQISYNHIQYALVPKGEIAPPPSPSGEKYRLDSKYLRDTLIKNETFFMKFEEQIDLEMHSHEDSIASVLFLGIAIYLGCIFYFYYLVRKANA